MERLRFSGSSVKACSEIKVGRLVMVNSEIGNPVDPREKLDLPLQGSMPRVSDVGISIARIIAPNASPMTLDGTNTYLISDPTSGSALLIDPGPDSESHLNFVKQAVSSREVELAGILLTHHHLDHSEAAAKWADLFDVGVSARHENLVFGRGKPLADGDKIRVGGRLLQVLETPGHVDDHLSFMMDDEFLFTGDHILGRSTSVISYPDGNLEKYIDSLAKLARVGPRTLLPGHGPVLSESISTEVIDYYISHRLFRIEQIKSQLEAHPSSDSDYLTELIYGEALSEVLFRAAKQSTLAALKYLEDTGQVESDKLGRYRVSKS